MKAMRAHARAFTGMLCLLPLLWSCSEQPAPRKDAVVTRPIQSPAPQKTAPEGGAGGTPAAPATVGSPVVASAPEATAGGRTLYNPTGKLDPFMPLFKDAPQEAASAPMPQTPKEPERPRTPLEKIDLAQLTLRAVVFAADGNRALVEEASGKGYIVRLGTSMGLNRGTVVDIQKEMVVIEEAVENAFGEKVVQKRELKLQKPPGE